MTDDPPVATELLDLIWREQFGEERPDKWAMTRPEYEAYLKKFELLRELASAEWDFDQAIYDSLPE